MRNLTKTLVKSITCLGFALCITLPAEARYENVSLRYDIVQPRKLGLQYDVYAGGFKALGAALELDLEKQAYDMKLSAETQGFIGKMFPWKADYTTSGHAEEGMLIPSLHTSTSTWKNSVKVTEMSFDPEGQVLKTTTQEGKSTVINRDIKPELTQDAVDMLTGALMAFQNARNTEKCAGLFPVFDGKRRFNVRLNDDGMDDIRKSKYSRFSGPALRCTVKMEPVAGFKKKDEKRGWMAVQNHTEARNKAPTLWLARLEENGPIVPVRMEIASDYGTVVAHLSAADKK